MIKFNIKIKMTHFLAKIHKSTEIIYHLSQIKLRNT